MFSFYTKNSFFYSIFWSISVATLNLFLSLSLHPGRTLLSSNRSMLISHPSIMWTHSSTWTNIELALCAFLSLFPKVLVLATMTWGLWAIYTQLHSIPEPWGLVAIAVAAVLYGLSIFAYFRVIYDGPGSPSDYPELRCAPQPDPEHYGRSPYDTGDYAHLYTLETPRATIPPTEIYSSHTFRDNQPTYKLCHVCNTWKPDRCHHCNSCKRCVLKMDHHCPWFATCIGYKNHKYFIQSLCYITSFCGLLLLLSGYELYRFFADQEFDLHSYLLLNLVFVFVLSFTFYVAVGIFSAFLVYLMVRNYSTIEFQDSRWNYSGDDAQYEFDSNGKRKKLGHLYDLGIKKNIRAVMGDTWAAWLLPIRVTTESLLAGTRNGVHFEINEDVYEKMCTNAKLQAQLNRQLAEYRERTHHGNGTQQQQDIV